MLQPRKWVFNHFFMKFYLAILVLKLVRKRVYRETQKAKTADIPRFGSVFSGFSLVLVIRREKVFIAEFHVIALQGRIFCGGFDGEWDDILPGEVLDVFGPTLDFA